VLGECKWQARPAGQDVLRSLVDKTGEIVPKQGQWRVAYLGFSRHGWTEAAQTYAGTFGAHTAPGQANWRPVGMALLDLAQLDADLYRWARHN
jgi:hypothetical protein